MLDRHGRGLPEREWRRWEYQQCRGAALLRHARDARGFEAAVGPYPVNDRQPATDLVLGDVEDAALFLQAAGGDLGRVSIDGNGGEPFGRSDVAQMLAEALFVDRQVVCERQNDGRNDAVRQIVGMTGHIWLSGDFVLSGDDLYHACTRPW